MTLQELTEAVKERAAKSEPLNNTCLFRFENGDTLFLDGTGEVNTVTNEDKRGDCLVEIKQANFEKMFNGKMDPTFAFMMGKMRIKGDATVAMKINKIFKG